MTNQLRITQDDMDDYSYSSRIGPRLKTIANWINTSVEGFEAKTSHKSTTPDGPKWGRIRVRECVTRYGYSIVVTNTKTGEEIVDHDSTETYRTNSDVWRDLSGDEDFMDQIPSK